MSKGKHDQVDMLHGPLLGKLILFALPLALSSILQQLFNAVDIAVLGQFATSQDQAAVGCTSGSMHDMTLMQARRAASWMEEEIAARKAQPEPAIPEPEPAPVYEPAPAEYATDDDLLGGF